MAVSLGDLARIVQGQVIGDADAEIFGAATLLDAGPGDITLIDRIDKADRLAASTARAAVVPRNFPVGTVAIPIICVDDMHAAFTAIVSHFRPPRVDGRIGISPQASISPTARIANNVDVHAGATIGNEAIVGEGSTIHSGAHVMAGCQLGPHVTLYPGAVLYENTIVGARSVIHASAIIGCHGFGYRLVDGKHQLCAQLGHVEIGADVEVGAASTIDRGTYGPTIIGEGTKIDNLVMIAHNCRIGRHNMICSQVGIAGSTTTGDYVVMAGQVGVRDHVRIGSGAVLGAKAGVSADVPAGAHVFGIPAIPEREQKIQFAAISKLPEMRRQLKALQQTVEELMREDANGGSGNQAA